MSYIINAYAATTQEVKQTTIYLRKLGIIGKNIHEFTVELRQLPEIFLELKAIGYSDAKENKWMLSNISNAGMTFSIFNTAHNAELVEATVFIPNENIVCIHTLNEKYLNGLKVK